MSTGTISIEAAQAYFPHSSGHLNTATIGLPPTSTTEAMTDAMQLWAEGRTSTHAWDGAVNRSRELFAGLLRVPVDQVTVGAHLSSMAGLIAASLRPGQTVLLPESDFTSLLWPFLAQEQRGVIIRLCPLDQLIDSLDSSVDWVAASSVQSATGQVIDLTALSAAARHHGVRTLLDTTQSQGWLPVNGNDFDAVACSAYKWLLSARGTAFMSINPELYYSITPSNAGWYAGEDVHASFYGSPLRLAESARRFDLSPAWLCFAGTVPSLELIASVGEQVIHDHNVGLANAFCEAIGIQAGGSAIVSMTTAPQVVERLRDAGLHFSERAGKVRLSFHLYNNMSDVEAAAACWTA